MTNRAYQTTTRQMQIESIADSIVFGTLSETKKQLAKAKLASLLLEEVNYSVAQEMQHPEKGRLEESARYDSKAFAKAFAETLTYGYGKLDKTTQERVPFLRLFRHRYKLKLKTAEREFLESKNPDHAKLRKVHTIQLFKTMVEKRGISKEEQQQILDFNVLNHGRCMEFLRYIRASADEIEQYLEISQKIYTESVERNLANSGESASPVSAKVLQQSIASFEQRNRQCAELVDLLEKAKTMAAIDKQKKTLLVFLPYYITLRIIEYYAYELVEYTTLQPYMDMAFWQYCKENWQMKEKKANDILASYLSLQPDTVRKKMNIVQRFLVKVQSTRCI